MLVRLTFGSREGQVCDLPVLAARAMLADGRAALPEGSAPVSPAPSPALSVRSIVVPPSGDPRRASGGRTTRRRA